jgi:hypothetical protein
MISKIFENGFLLCEILEQLLNNHYKITTKISKSAKYRIRDPTKIIKGANYKSDASDISESSNMELSQSEADLVWIHPEILEKADRLESAEIPELFQISSKKDMKELGKSEFGKLVRSIIFDNLGSYKRLGPAKFEEIFNEKLKLLFRNHNPEMRGLENHLFLIRGSNRQILFIL